MVQQSSPIRRKQKIHPFLQNKRIKLVFWWVFMSLEFRNFPPCWSECFFLPSIFYSRPRFRWSLTSARRRFVSRNGAWLDTTAPYDFYGSGVPPSLTLHISSFSSFSSILESGSNKKVGKSDIFPKWMCKDEGDCLSGSFPKKPVKGWCKRPPPALL